MAHIDTTRTTIPFGKYRGKVLPEIPSGYLLWLTDQDFMEQGHPELLEMIEFELKWRDEQDVNF